jgi:predicted AlkP superfamily pyrophosphatase or phosphodiesterase
MRSFQSICLVLVWFLLMNSNTYSQPKTPKAVFIIVDGVPADVMEKLDLPNFNAIKKAGGYTRTMVGGHPGTYTQTPTISAVGYNSVLTGVYAHKHNVWGNDITAPNYQYQNLFRLLKETSPQKTIGIFSSWQDNRTKLVGEGLAAAGNIQFDFEYDGLELDTIRFPHDKAAQYMHRIDDMVSDSAARAIQASAPDLSWVYLEYTDDMGHRFGDSETFYTAVKYADAQVGKIWQAVQDRQQHFNEDWMIVITTDHGRDSLTGRNHGGQSAREKSGWIYTNKRPLNERFAPDQSAIVDIMPSILRHLQLPPSASVMREIDGIPFVGPLSVSTPQISIAGQDLKLTWKAHAKKGEVKIYYARAPAKNGNAFPDYQLLTTQPLKNGEYRLQWDKPANQPYVFLLEGQHNSTNTWWVPTVSKNP